MQPSENNATEWTANGSIGIQTGWKKKCMYSLVLGRREEKKQRKLKKISQNRKKNYLFT